MKQAALIVLGGVASKRRSVSGRAFGPMNGRIPTSSGA